MVKNLMGKCSLIAVACSLSISAFALAETPFKLNVPAGELIAALKTLAAQSDVELMYQPEQLKGLRTAGVSGTYSTQEAIAILLKGTPLQVHTGEGGAMVIVKPAHAPPPQTSAPTPADARVASQDSEPAESSAAHRSFWQRLRLAQTDEARYGTSSATSPVSSDSVRIEEVVVTAQKREERLQDVPLSVSVVSAAEIDRRGLFHAADYLRGVPGANQVEGGPFGQAIVIRGIETSPISQNFNSGTTTATYFGETPTTNSAGLAGNSNVDIKLVDIERVEVLRGPQGTAFGNASLGGAVRTIPVAPKLDRVQTKIGVGYSATSGSGGDNYEAQAVGNLPLIGDRLALRAVAYKYRDSGFYQNRAGSSAAFQAVVAANGAQAFASDDDDVGSYDSVGGRFAALFQASENLHFTLSHLTQKSETDGIPMSNSGTYEQTLLEVAPQQVRRGQEGGFYDSDIDITNATMEYALGWGDLLATYSHTESESAGAFASGYNLGTNQPQAVDAQSSHRENVGELRLATRLAGAWNALGGLYYEELDDGAGDEYFQSFYWLGSPATNPNGPGSPAFLGIASDRRHLEQKAAFAEVSWQFLPAWTLTGGARYYDYERTRLFTTVGGLAVVGGNTSVRSAVNATGTNFRGNLSFKPSDNTLVYAGWSEGFRLGVPLGGGLPPALCDVNNDGIVDGTSSTIESTKGLNSDEVESYEVGSKFVLLGRRLTVDAAVFRTDWIGMPVTASSPPPPLGCSRNYQANAGEARSEGVEFQASFRINGPLRGSLGGSWINAELTEDVPALRANKGNRLAGVPEVNANAGLEYGFTLRGYEASVRADSIYVGSFYGNILEGPFTKAGDYVKVDLRSRLQIRNFNFDIYAENLTDEDAFTFRRPSSTTSVFFGHRLRPRTLGFQVGYSF